VKVLSTVDELVLAEVYPAGEAPIVGADARSLVRSVRLTGRVEPVFVERTSEMRAALLSRLRAGDVVVTMGAGSIANLAPNSPFPAGWRGESDGELKDMDMSDRAPMRDELRERSATTSRWRST